MLSDGMQLQTLATLVTGQRLTVSIDSETGAVRFCTQHGGNCGGVGSADVYASNGIIHALSDVLVPGDDPRMITEMIDLARQAQRTLMQNLFFSVFITVTLVFAVIQRWYDQLWVGVLIHELSVVIVILNGARLAQNGQSIALLKETLASVVAETRRSFSMFRRRYLPARD